MLVLDQCSQCGGLWCDKFELFPIASSEVDRLDPVDRGALHKPAPAPAERHCPRCQIALRQFKDPLLPADVLIDRCPLCDGMWLNAGSLRRFDEYRRHGQPPKPIPKELVQTLTEHCREPAKWSTVQNLSSATDSPAADADADRAKSAAPFGRAPRGLRCGCYYDSSSACDAD